MDRPDLDWGQYEVLEKQGRHVTALQVDGIVSKAYSWVTAYDSRTGQYYAQEISAVRLAPMYTLKSLGDAGGSMEWYAALDKEAEV